MRKLLLLCLPLILSATSFSQTDFRPGYIISTDNDTIKGLIDYKGNKASTEICLFKYNPESEAIKFTPVEIKAYRFIDSKYYISKKIGPEKKDSLLFVEFLIDGIVDIYYYRNSSGENYMIDKGDGKLILLDNKDKDVVVDGTRFVRHNKPYVGILKYIFMNSPTVSKEVEKISLDHKSLISLAKNYHSEVCTDKECIIYEKKLPLTRITAGLLLGFNINSIHYREDLNAHHAVFELTRNKKAVFPSAGIFVTVNMPAVNERLFLQYSGMLGKRSFSMNSWFKEALDTSTQINETLDFSQFDFENILKFRYEFPGRKLRPVLEAGYFLNYFFNNVSDYHVFVDNVEYYVDNSSVYPYKNIDMGFEIGAGITGKIHNRRNFHLNIDYQSGRGVAMKLPSRNFILRFGIQIGK